MLKMLFSSGKQCVRDPKLWLRAKFEFGVARKLFCAMIFGLLREMPVSRRALFLGLTFALNSPYPALHSKISLKPSRLPTDLKEEKSAVGPGPAPQRSATREAFSVAHRSKSTANNLDVQPARIEGERLKPIRRVVREIERRDGTILRIEVPVYPPFKLKDRRETEN